MESPKVEIKGIREGLLVVLGEGEWDEVLEALLEHVDEKSEFLRGGRLILEVGNHTLRAAELGWLRDRLSEKGLSLWAVLSNSAITEQTARTLGLATRIKKPAPDLDLQIPEGGHYGEKAILVHRTLRSGYSLQHKGHVVVVGDVNPGAEIVAGGNVIVWGCLRGMVHAGAEGDEQAFVCALDLSPTQLRIADQIAITPEQRNKPQPEIARLQDGKVVAEPWKPPKI